MTSSFDDLLDLGLDAAFGKGPEPTTDEAMPPRIGRYTIRMLLGRGGLGSVFLGRDDQLGRDVAVKVLHRTHAGSAGMQQRFNAEARTCSQLQHPGIVSVHELGTTDDGRPYYTMRVVAGQTLAELLRPNAATTGEQRRRLDVLERAAQAVAFAHRHGVVHGDLTPNNVMVGEFGEVQVLDWGLSRHADAARPTTPAVGTPAYMAPEQARDRGEHIDRRTDVFGLGAILCEILTGLPPYVGASIYQIHQRAAIGALDDALRRLAAVAGDRALIELARASLDPDPDRRPDDASVFARSLSAHLQEVEARARRSELEAIEQRVLATAARREQRLTVMLVAVVAAAVVVASATWFWWHTERAGRQRHADGRAIAALAAANGARDRAAESGDPTAARALVTTAVEAAAAADVDPRHVAAAAALRQDLDRLAAAAAHDAVTRNRLADGRWHAEDDRTEAEIESDYRDAFRRCGVDVDADGPDAVVAAIRSHRLQPELTQALHWWALLRRRMGLPPDSWQPLLHLADGCDRDPDRTDLRRAFLAGDADRLLELAASPATLELGADTIDLLGHLVRASGQRNAALALLRRGHLRHPGDYGLCHDLATMLARDADAHEITELAKVGAALRPDNPHALVDLALALLQEKRPEAARPLSQRALDLDPNYPRSWLCAVRLREATGDQTGAVAAAREFARLEPTASGPLLLAQTLQHAGHLDDAVAACRRAVALRPDWHDAHFTLGALLFDRTDLVEAIAELRRAQALARTPGQTERILGSALMFAGRHREAVAMLRLACDAMPDVAENEFMLAVVLLRAGELDEAAGLLARVRQAPSLDPAVRRSLPQFDAQLRKLADVDRLLAQWRRDPATLVDAVALGDLALARGDDADADRLYTAAVTADAGIERDLTERRGRAAARLAFLLPDDVATAAQRRNDAARARELLAAALADLVAAEPGSPAADATRRQTLGAWCMAPELQATRSGGPGWLPTAERQAWAGWWAEVERALARPAVEAPR